MSINNEFMSLSRFHHLEWRRMSEGGAPLALVGLYYIHSVVYDELFAGQTFHIHVRIIEHTYNCITFSFPK